MAAAAAGSKPASQQASKPVQLFIGNRVFHNQCRRSVQAAKMSLKPKIPLTVQLGVLHTATALSL
jgi:hypothetical protein